MTLSYQLTLGHIHMPFFSSDRTAAGLTGCCCVGRHRPWVTQLLCDTGISGSFRIVMVFYTTLIRIHFLQWNIGNNSSGKLPGILTTMKVKKEKTTSRHLKTRANSSTGTKISLLVMCLGTFPALESSVGFLEPETALSFSYVSIYLIFNPDMTWHRVVILRKNCRSQLSSNSACPTCLGSLY